MERDHKQWNDTIFSAYKQIVGKIGPAIKTFMSAVKTPATHVK